MNGMYATILKEDFENKILQSIGNNINCKIINEKEKEHFNFWLKIDFKSVEIDKIKQKLKELSLSEHEIEDLTFDYDYNKNNIITVNLLYATDLLKTILKIEGNIVFDENVFVDYTDEEKTLLYILYINKN